MIALCTELSRRAAEQEILSGHVKVNGEVVTKLGVTVDPKMDHVRFKGKLLHTPKEHVYLAFNKPLGMLVTKSDPQGRKTIWDKLEKWKKRLNAAGRLDFETEGLLLLSDDGVFLNKLAHPRHELWKTYHVKVRGQPARDILEQLAAGVKLKDGKTLPAKVKIDRKLERYTWVEVQIREGRNRQVRRMFDALGYSVVKLKRVAMGPVKLANMRAGKWRFLTERELDNLNRLV